MRQYDVDRIILALVEEGQDNSSRYGFGLGDVIRFTPMQVGTILSDLDIEPERKKGRWFNHVDRGMCECDICGEMIETERAYRAHFCPNCGAYMGGDT